MNRPKPGALEQRTAPETTIDGKRIRSRIPYSTESRDLGGWREIIEPTALRGAKLDDLVATVDHAGVPLGRYPGTIELEDRSDGLHWSLEPPESRADVREAVERGDLKAGSWRMVVAPGGDEWRGDTRHIHHIAELRDVAVVTSAAYPSADVEYRSHNPAEAEEDTTMADAADKDTTTTAETTAVETTEPATGNLRVEDRSATTAPVVEQRTRDALRPDQSLVEWGETRGLPGFTPEARALSFDRLVRGLVTGDWQGADAEQRAVSESPFTAGGHMVPTPVAATVIDKARNASRVFQAGATTIPMTSSSLKYPRLVTEATPAWRNEAAAITDQAMTFDAVTFTAQTMAMLVKISLELFEDAPNADDVIANSFAQQIALELDRVALRGTGTAPEPRGIVNQTGVTLTAHGANGSTIGSPPSAGVMGWEFLVQAAGAVRNSNFEPNAQIMAPRTDQSLALLRDTTNQYIAPPRYLDNLTRLTTKQVPINLTVGSSSDCSEVYTGQWSQLLVGIRTGFTLKFLGERFIDNGQYAFLAYLRGDIQLAQPAAFNVDTGVRS
jgi:HK97 family phage major capsid protein